MKPSDANVWCAATAAVSSCGSNGLSTRCMSEIVGVPPSGVWSLTNQQIGDRHDPASISERLLRRQPLSQWVEARSHVTLGACLTLDCKRTIRTTPTPVTSTSLGAETRSDFGSRPPKTNRKWEVVCTQCGDTDGPAEGQSETIRTLRGPYSSKRKAQRVVRQHARHNREDRPWAGFPTANFPSKN